MKHTLLVLFTLLSFSVISQNHLFGLKGAVSFNEVTGPIITKGYMTRSSFGFTYEYKIKPRFSLLSELLYAGKGFRTEFTEYNVVGTPLIDHTIDLKFDYLSLPFKFGYLIEDKLKLFLRLGVIPSLLINNYEVVASSNGGSSIPYSTRSPNDIYISGIIEVGVVAKSFETSDIYVTVGFQEGFSSIYESTISITQSPRHRSLELAVGYRRSFGF